VYQHRVVAQGEIDEIVPGGTYRPDFFQVMGLKNAHQPCNIALAQHLVNYFGLVYAALGQSAVHIIKHHGDGAFIGVFPGYG
jgi:hypothetical protein